MDLDPRDPPDPMAAHPERTLGLTREELERPLGTRRVLHTDAIAWLQARERGSDGASFITSLPDSSELPELGLQPWCNWFEHAAELVASRTSQGAVAIFFQTDTKADGTWIDKANLVARGVERAGMRMCFHKIVCRLPPGSISFGRPSYSHLLAYAWPEHQLLRVPPTPDILADAGYKPGSKAMGANACLEACRFVRAQTASHTVIDPFCGWGTLLAVANAVGLDALGLDLSKRMCQRARRLKLDRNLAPE